MPGLSTRLIVLFILLSAGLKPPRQACADELSLPRNDADATERYFDGLRERRLFSLAETVCLRMLNDTGPGLVERTRYAVELSRTYVDHAAYAESIEEQTEMLDLAARAIDEVLSGRDNHPQALLLQAQKAIVTAREVELFRWRHELHPLADADLQQALERAARVTPELQQLDQALSAELRAPRRDVLGERLQPYQLRGLLNVVRFRAGALQLDRAALLDSGSPDRSEALVLADQWFRRVAAGAPGDRLTLESQLAVVQVTRLSGDLATAGKLLNALLQDLPPPAVLDDAMAELVELHLADGRLADALDELRAHRLARRGLTGRLNWLNVVVLSRLSQATAQQGDPALAAELMEQAKSFAQRAGTEGSAYWAARARQQIDLDHRRHRYGGDVAPWLEQGQNSFAAGRLPDAIRAYTRAWELVRQARTTAPDAAAEVGSALGSLLVQEGRYEDAADVLRDAVLVQPAGEQAAASDLLRAWCLTRLYEVEPTRSRREACMTALEEHRARFPASATAAEAAWLLAQIEERRLQSTQALRLYAAIPDSHARFAEANVAVARCGEVILSRLAELGRPVDEWEPAILRLLDDRCAPLLTQARPLSPLQAELLLRTARLRLNAVPPDFITADSLLNQLFRERTGSSGSPAVPGTGPLPANAATETGSGEELTAADRAALSQLRYQAAALRVISLAGQGQMREAYRLVEDVARRDSAELVAVLSGLTAAAAGLPAPQQRELGELQLHAFDLSGARLEGLPAEEQTAWRQTLASAHDFTGRPAQAADLLKPLLDADPENHDLRRRIATRLMAANTPERLAAARQHWQKLESTFPPGSADWFSARMETIRVSLSLGQTDEARKVLRVTRLLYPDPPTAEIRGTLDELAREAAN